MRAREEPDEKETFPPLFWLDGLGPPQTPQLPGSCGLFEPLELRRFHHVFQTGPQALSLSLPSSLVCLAAPTILRPTYTERGLACLRPSQKRAKEKGLRPRIDSPARLLLLLLPVPVLLPPLPVLLLLLWGLLYFTYTCY